jgi:hypothetical protein
VTKYLAGSPKQFEYDGPFDDLDGAYAHSTQLGRDDWEVGDVQSHGVHLRFRKSRDSAIPDEQSSEIVSLPSDQGRPHDLDPVMVRFLRNGPAGDERREARMRRFSCLLAGLAARVR